MFDTAKIYDRIYRDKPYDAELAEIASHIGSGGPVLDIGGGTGNFATRIQEKGWGVDLIDIDARMVGIAEQKGIRAQRLDIQEAHSNAIYGTAIMMFHVFNFLVWHEKALKNIFQSLMPGGKIIFDVWNPLIKQFGWKIHWDWLYTRIVRKEWFGNTCIVKFWFPFLGFREKHYMTCPPEEWITEALKRVGFEIVDIKYKGGDILFVAKKP